jgi:heterodisulfide reductase subunit A2
MSDSGGVLVVGGGPAGLRAAADLADLGVPVVLVERRGELGGAPIRWKYKTLAPELRPTEEVMGPMIAAVESHPLVKVHRDSVVERVFGRAGNFRVALRKSGAGAEEIGVGAIIAATGFEHFDASRDPRYEYGRAANVLGIHELEGMLKEGRVVCKDGRAPKRIAFVFCVGSRDRATNPWCCTVCCGVSIKQGIELKQLLKDVEIYNIYIDVRTFGLWEQLYWTSMEEHGINFIRGRVSQIFDTGTRLLVKGEDTLVRGPFEVLMDMVVLAVGIMPGEGTAQAAKVLDLQCNTFGFLQPRHPNIHYDSGKEGIFLAGACVAPMSVEEAILAGSAAAMQAAKFVRPAPLRTAAAG